MTAIRIAAVSGSLRASSINTALLRTVAFGAPDGVTVELVSLGALPLFNPDLEADLPEAVRVFRATIVAADGVIVASPEYAHGISGVLKNALDWLVGCEGFAGKPVLLLNAAPTRHHAIAALRETLSTMAARTVENHSLVDFVTTVREGGFCYGTCAWRAATTAARCRHRRGRGPALQCRRRDLRPGRLSRLDFPQFRPEHELQRRRPHCWSG